MIDQQQELGKKEDELKKKLVEDLFTERARVHVEVHGRVQGVFFRDFAKREADKLGLTGWVRNTNNNSVEVVAEGEKSQLRKLIIACKKGSPLAKVDKVDYEYGGYTGKFGRFFINY